MGEKKQSSILVDESTIQKISLLADNIAATYAGLGPDFRVLCQSARKTVMKYQMKFQEEMYVSTLCREVSLVGL